MVNEELQKATAFGRALPISTKQSIEIASFIRGKSLNKAISLLERVVEKKQPVPYTRFMKGGTGHRKKIGPGRYPVKSCKAIIGLLKSAETNAQNKGLDISSLFIKSIIANRASRAQHFGRRRRDMKRTHIDVTVAEKINEKRIKEKK